MQIEVTLAGHTAHWRFRGSTALESWIGTCPWQKDGGVRVCRVTAADFLPQFTAGVHRMIQAHDGGRSSLRVYPVGCLKGPANGASLEELLLNRLQSDERQSEYRRLSAAARLCEGRETVFVVETASGSTTAWKQAADEFLDRIEKAGGTRRPTIVLLAISTEPDGLPDDLTVGMPADSILLCEDGNKKGLWQRYVHLRLAWESGGNLVRAKTWDEKYAVGKLPIGSDDLLEHVLNEAAREQFHNTLPTPRARILEFAANSGDEIKIQEILDKNMRDLIGDGLIWHCPGNALLSPTPWTARSLLLQGSTGPARFLLRNCLICAPLARDILAACFELEAQERTLCCASLPPDDSVSEKTQIDFESFMAGDSDSVAPHYPKDSPARPDSIWCFASFGEILQHAKRPGDSYRHRRRHDLRQLRNTLSHGHYVCWQAVQTLYRLRSELGFGG